MSFKVGQEVMVTEDYDGNNTKGQLGKVIHVNKYDITIEFHNKLKQGHDGSGRGRYGYCWVVGIDKVVPASPLFKLEEEMTEAFKNKHISLARNGNTLKLIKRDGRVVCMYNVGTKTRMNVTTPVKIEQDYVNLFNQIIEKYENIEKEREIC